MENINAIINDTKATRAEDIVSTTPELGGRQIALVDLDLCDVDYEYQRVRTSHVNYLYDNFNINECDPLLVSYRNGRFYIIDGQHRYYAALAKGIKRLLCIIRTGLTMENEARIFVTMNKSRKPLTPFDEFKANIACGNENIPDVKVDLTIKKICDKYGIRITKVTTNSDLSRILRSVSIARRIVKSELCGEKCLSWIFEVLTKGKWCDCEQAYKADMMDVLKTYYLDNVNDIDVATAKLAKVMEMYSPAKLQAYARKHYSDYGRFAGLSNALRDLA